MRPASPRAPPIFAASRSTTHVALARVSPADDDALVRVAQQLAAFLKSFPTMEAGRYWPKRELAGVVFDQVAARQRQAEPPEQRRG